ncbi:hypothetical protein [Desulfosarcina sp.]|uniref:hypothetical protein n=1 Tax=Desulfosarcina sp. TaxID=2027861 RepID=UPI0039707945
MVDFQNILFPVALTDISAVIPPYVATVASRFGAKLHLLHVLRRFDWFLLKFLNQFLAQIKADGRFETIYNRWFRETDWYRFAR